MASNTIVLENQKPGTPKSVWDAPASNQIEGFATQFSVDNGSAVSFKINLNVAQNATAPYHIEIYRLGYYGGAGATLVTTLNNLTGIAQPNPFTDSRGLVDAGNWTVSATWQTPETAVSGVYLAKLVRDDNGATNQIPFVVRDDGGTSDIVLQTSDTTWQAYNGWAGRNGQVGGSLYGGFDQPDNLAPDQAPIDPDRAFAVSYNRPFITRDGGGTYAGPQDYLFGADYSAIYFLEKNGYDVSYISGVDTDRLGVGNLTNHLAYISVGHDEYWSGGQRANVEAARDAGVNLLFWSGNEVYWKTRWEDSIVDGTPFRTLVSYKETRFNYSLDAGPSDYPNVDPSTQWTGTWRDIRFVGNPNAVGARPENSLTGQLFAQDDAGGSGGALDIPAAFAGLRVWRDTGIGPNGAQDIAPGIIGYEWDSSPDDANRPPTLIKLSETTIPWSDILIDQGNRTAAGTATHNLSLYRDDSGALVFGAGTVFWTWGLSNQHDSGPYGANIETRALQQFAVNMFADMGIQPQVADAILASQGLVRATATNDHIAATATLNNLPDTVGANSTVTISGTAADIDNNPANADGRVAVVEVSTDNGQTWRVAQGTTNWSFNWTPTAEGTYTIRVRAIDDSLNVLPTSQLASDVVTVGGGATPDTVTLFGSTAATGILGDEGQAVEVGMKFSASVAGQVTALRYWRAAGDAGDTDVRQGHLWSATGQLLGTATFTSTAGQSGWQVANLATPVTLTPGQTYIVSYNSADNYIGLNNYFTSTVTDPFNVLSAPASSASGGNGVFAYGAGAPFPNQTWMATNYWVDVVFDPGGAPASPQVALTTTSVTHAEGNSGVTTFDYTVTRTGSTTGASTVNWAVAGSGASPVNAADFQGGVLPSGTVTFAAGETSKVITVSVVGDTVSEPNETFSLTLSNPSGATLGTATATGTITNDDSTTPPPTTTSLFGTATATGTPGNQGYAVEVGMKFSASVAGQVTALRYWRATGDAGDTDVRQGHLWSSTGQLLGTATFTSTAGQSGWQVANLATPVSLTPGQTYIVSYNTADNYIGLNNYFTSTVTDPTNVLSAPSSSASGGNGVYGDGSGAVFPTQTWMATNYWVDVVFAPGGAPASPQIALTTPSVTHAEGNSGVTTFDYTVTRTGSTTGASTVNWAVAGSGASPANAADFQGGVLPSGTLTFAAGETSKVITVSVVGDTVSEPNETFSLTLSNPNGATLGTATATGTITNDDSTTPPPTTTSLFGTTTATGTPGNQGYAVEVGMKFSAAVAGQVTALRYWRATGDAGDTDVRQGHLWSSTGQLLGTATFTSTAGQSGWQVANLATPVSLTPGQTYIVSYNTADNYIGLNNYFTSTVTDPTNVLSAPSSSASGGNGVYGDGSGAVFPTQTWMATNYWVDVVFAPGGAPASPQVALTTTSVSHAEGNSGVTTFDYTVTRTGSTTGASTVNWAVAGSGASPANAADFQGGVLPSGTLTFAAGETSKVITVSVVGDTVSEPNETFSLTLSNPNGATLGTATATGTITNDDSTTPPPTTTSLFGATTASGFMNNDGQATELGMKFTASTAGQVTALRYWRPAGDAGDTDVRDGHLWSSTGQLLGTVTFTSTAGQSGWQVANLATPVSLTPGATYVVSYKTADNYQVARNYFTSSVTDTTGQLTAPSNAASGGNGVYTYGSGVLFPNATYQSSNYWVDVVFAPGSGGANQPPAFTSSAAFSRPENNALVGTVTASDPDNNPITYAIAGGVDQSLFTINPATGELRFTTAPNFEAPADNGANNVYNVTVSASDGVAPPVQQAIAVTVTDVVNEGANQPPVANNDAFSTGEATVLNGDVVANDSDPNGAALAVSAVNGVAANVGTPILLPSGARLTMNASGAFTYDPNGAFDALNTGQTATDSFAYTVSDGALTANATSTITINGMSAAGGQTLSGTNGANTLNGGTGNDSISGLGGADQLNGNGGNDTISGGDGLDVLNGGAGADSLTAGAGADTLIGGAGTDTLAGAGGADVYRWTAFSESSTTSPDVIMGFEGAGAAGGDRIDVSALSPGVFAFNGTGAFSGGGVASIRYVASGGVTEIQFDDGSGGAPEMIVRLNSVVSLNSGDFIL